MLNGRFISSKIVIEKVFSDYGFSRNTNIYDFFNWIGEALFALGEKQIYTTKTTGESAENPTIKISNYQGDLPCDLYQVESCRNAVTGVTMRYSSDKFHMLTDHSPDLRSNSDTTYILNNNYITTSFETGEVNMTYLAVATDENGWPMVPNRMSVILACTDYVALKYAQLLYFSGSYPDKKLDRIAQNWYANGYSAQIDAAMPNVDQMETLKNMLLRLSPKINQHSAGFIYNGQQEERYIK